VPGPFEHATFDGPSARRKSALNRSFSDETSLPPRVLPRLVRWNRAERLASAPIIAAISTTFALQHTQFSFVHQALAILSKRPPERKRQQQLPFGLEYPNLRFFAVLTSIIGLYMPFHNDKKMNA